jgi:fluoroacetyl-CoA thioesterase
MKDTLKPGVKAVITYEVPLEKTVPHIFGESAEMQGMPQVLASGFMIGLMEWAAVKALSPHLDEGEGSLGVHFDVSHDAATPPGFKVTAEAEVTEIDGKRVWLAVRAHDGVDTIGEGFHQRAVVKWDKFTAKVIGKVKAGAK